MNQDDRIVARSKELHGMSDAEVSALRVRLQKKHNKISAEDKGLALKIMAAEMRARMELFHLEHDSDLANMQDCDVCAANEQEVLFGNNGSGIA